MDAKDLRIGTALGERNDGSKYSQSGVALPTKSYQDNGCNPLAKAEVAAVRPCAVIGPDRVVPPPTSDAYLKKSSVDQWSCPDNLYPRPPEYPHKHLNNVNPSRNISPRQTFQENMQRIMVPPTYSAAKHADESILGQVQDRSAALSKNTKQTMAPEVKYCDVPYAVNLLNEHKIIRETEMCVPSVNSPLTRAAPSGWPPGGVNLHPPRAYGAHDVYQYPQYPSCAGPRPSVMPMARPHRSFQEDSSYVYPDSYYQDASVRYKPYPSVKERYPQARYDYINNYPNPFHPPPPYASHKYDIPNTRPPHPYSVYPHLKYLENRILDPNIDVCQRPNQQSFNYNMQFRNQVIHPTYGSALGNPQNKVPSYPLDKSSNKLSLDNTKSYVDYENAKAKYSLPDSYFVNEMARVHQVQKPVAMPNYASPGIHSTPLQQFHRKDNMTMKSFEYNMPHYRHFEHPLGFNPSGHHPPQFSPSALAISPTDSNTSNDTTQTQCTSQEDCGYVSQSSTTSARSIDSNRLQNEYYRRYDYRYRPIIGSSHTLGKSDMTPNKENKKIDVRQFLSMWSEGDEDNTNSNSKEISATNNYRRQESVRNQDQLYVLGLVNVPSEELAKYEHIQKVSKLPENIKGYNSIELLNQFEEVIESSNMSNIKPSTPKDFFSIKDRKNAIKQIVEVLPRPVSPLDVEAKISQSVIHKEVGCNFEIKPCSPKMLNVEIAAPVQNILGERSIEKVSNPLSNKAKSPLPTRIDGNTTCNSIQRQEGTHTSYENISCKMIGSPFAANNMESVKTDYSLHDLETSSGVCLASLPRLDNEIELNFPEVNQQFINANKGSRNLQDSYNREVKDDNLKTTTATNIDKANNDLEKHLNVSLEDSGAKLSKLSKYRKAKVNTGCLEYPEDESKANAVRTDSVIIENPENARKHEDNKEKISFHVAAVTEKENTPINLTTQSISHIESEFDTTNSPKTEKHAIDCALDFSFSKTENDLPSLNVFDEELVKSSHKEMLMETITSHCNSGDHEKKSIVELSNKPSELLSEYTLNNKNNSIIVINNQSSTYDNKKTLKEETNVLEAPKVNVDSNGNDDKMNSEINIDKNKLNTGDKTSLSNVIVKHKHKNKSKISKVKLDIKKSNLQRELRNKNFQNLKKKNLCSYTESKNYDCPSFGEKAKKSKSVIQNNIYSEEKDGSMEVAARDMYKNEKVNSTCENNKASGNPNNISESHHYEDKINTVKDQSNIYLSVIKNDTETRLAEINDSKNNSSNLIVNMIESANEVLITNDEKIKQSVKINDSVKDSKSLIDDIVQEINDTTRLICDTDTFSESYVGISQANKYYNDLISESELFIDKTYCIGVNQSPSSSIAHVETTSNNSTDGRGSDINTKNTIDGITLDKSNILGSSVATILQDDLVSKSDLLEHKQCCIDNNAELNMDSLEVFENSVDVGRLEFTEKDVTQSFNSKDACENTSTTVNYLAQTDSTDGIEVVDKTHANTPSLQNSVQHSTVVTETKLIPDKKLSFDSGCPSNKNSFKENDEEIIGFLGSSSDSVFDEKESGMLPIALNDFVKNNNEKNDALQPLSSISASTCNSEANYLILENKTSEDSNNKLETQLTTLKSNSVFKDHDTNEQMDENDVCHPISDRSITSIAGSTLVPGIETFEDANIKIKKLSNTLQSDIVFDNVDANMQILFAQPNEEVAFLNVDKIDNFKLVDKNVQIYNNLDIEFNMSKNELDKVNLENKTLLNTEKKLNTNEIIKVDAVDEEDKMKNENCFNILDKDRKNDDLSDFVENMDIVEPCFKICNKDCRYTKIDEGTYSKKKYIYGKELYSPWIQKLIIYNEGKTTIQDINGTNEIEQQNDNIEVISLENPNNSVIKEATLDDVIHEVYSETETENRDINQKHDVEYENRNCETNSRIILNCSNDKSNFSFDVISNQEGTFQINEDKISITERKCKSEFDDECVEVCTAQDNLVDTHEIPCSYPNNSIISQITENNFHTNANFIKSKFQNQNDTSVPINQRRLLKRSFSDSALNTNIKRNDYHTVGFEDLNNYSWPAKRNKIDEFVNFIPNNRRNSVNFEENVSFCILIDDNCIITEENEECIAELQDNVVTETENAADDSESLNELDVHETNVHFSNSVVLEYQEENTARGEWVEDITCVEDVFSDEVAENVVISAPSSPTDFTEEYEHNGSSIYENVTSCHTDEIRFLRENIMSQDDSQIVNTLYQTHQMDKTLLYGDKTVESDSDPENILSESDSWKPSPTHSPDYIDPTNASNDFRLETPENKENVFVKELSPLRRIDDYLDVSSAENETDDQNNTLPQHIAESAKLTQDGSVYSCESSLYNMFDYQVKDRCTDTTMPTSSSSSPEVSSTTSEEKSSSILLKITNLNGSRVSQVNEIELNNRPRCKFTEKKDYSTSSLNFPNRPLITKAAQKYIPPIKESIRDLKVKISLPQQSLNKLKQLKLSRNEPKIHKQQSAISRIAKKPKPNFDDVLKSIDEIQIKRHKEKSKKIKTVVPKVLIKKNENGSHYASTPKRNTNSPDLTGRKWQPWVYLEKNHFIDKMAIRNKTKAIFSHRKNTFVLAEKFKKYKSVSSTKFIITQPKTPGQLKYTIRLKHSF